MTPTTIDVRDGSTNGRASDTPAGRGRSERARPAMDLFELPDRYEVHLDLPGVAPEAVEVTEHEGTLVIEAPTGRRRFRLGEDVDTEGISASAADGVLVLRLPRASAHRPRRIEVRGA